MAVDFSSDPYSNCPGNTVLETHRWHKRKNNNEKIAYINETDPELLRHMCICDVMSGNGKLPLVIKKQLLERKEQCGKC